MSLDLELSALSLEDKKVVILISNDGFTRSIEMKSAKKAMVINRLIEDLDISADSEKDIEIPLPNVASTELDKVIDFLNNHSDDASSATEFREILLKNKIAVFDRDFIEVEQKILVNLYKVSNYLDIETLKELCAWKITRNIKGKKPDEINEFWNFENDFSAEKRREVKEGHAWTEQKA